jgi:nitrogen fixation/metabolism regulation signal transduction histidine kinase
VNEADAMNGHLIKHLTLGQVSLLAGIIVGLGLLLVLIAYGFRRFRKQMAEGSSFKEKPPRAENESAFMAATVQAVIADLKRQLSAAQQQLRETARESEGRKLFLNVILRELPQGVIILDGEGFVQTGTARAREILQADLWSRRTYAEVLGADSELAAIIKDAIERGSAVQRSAVTVSGSASPLVASAVPVISAGGRRLGVVLMIDRDEVATASAATTSPSETSRPSS